jgi:carboxypeptidase C (cathepsin A)
MKWTTRALAVAFVAAPVLSAAQIPQALIDHRPSVAVTKQTGTFDGKTVPYTATVEEHILNGREGTPNAFLTTIAYVRDDVSDKTRRPVAFVFNGGPGASSSPLHFGGIGPRVGGRGGVANNPYSILDAVDLVFVDPVGTGFSRPYSTEIGKEYYWNQTGDAVSTNQVIDRWLAKNGRERSPRYLIGESYGTVRIGEMLKVNPSARFDGIVLVSAVAGQTRPAYLGFARTFPSMAVSAWYHEKIARNGRTVDQMWNESLDFVKKELIPALAKDSSISPDEKRRMATKMSELIGLPADLIEQKNLRLSPQDWLMNILKDKNLRVSNQDTRATGPLVLTAEQAANSSPADGLGGTRIGTAMQGPAVLPGSREADSLADPQRTRSALETYLRNDLQFQTLEGYRSLNLDINGFWRSTGRPTNYDVAGLVAEGMKNNPAMRMFWIQGYFDLNTPAYAAIHSYELAGLTGERVSGQMAPGPHTAFATDETKQILSAALRKWIR